MIFCAQVTKMNYYSHIAKSYDELHGEEQTKKLKIVKKHAKLKGKILDLGSGTGLSKKFFKNIICVDPTKEMLQKGDIQAKAEKLPFKDKTFNSVLCITAIHHFNLKKAIPEIKRVSKPNCRYAFSILKKAKKFKEIRKELHKHLDLKEINEEKDLILISK